ncbi:MAG: hypothetical protein NTV86_20950 [Planctomycetota bacterium]|nr:hypothetical protein [Planctomycetota bacterium]
MSTLTKVCIVVLVVLNLVCVPVFITVATIVPNYRKAFLEEQERKLIAVTNSQAVAAGANSQKAQYEKDAAAQAAQIAEIKTALLKAETQVKTDAVELVRLQSLVASADDSTKREQTNVVNLTAINKDRGEQNDKLRTQISQKDGEIIDLRKLKEEAEARSAHDLAALKLIQEQLVAATNKNLELTQKLEDALAGRKVSNATTTDIVAAEKGPILGTITAVNGNLASINVGKVKGIEKGMSLVIFRSDEFIGRLQIESVELDHAAGVIVDNTHPAKINDKVVSKIPLN